MRLVPDIAESLLAERDAPAVDIANGAAAALMQFCDHWQGDDAHFLAELTDLCRELTAAQPNTVSLLNLCTEVLRATERETTIYVRGQAQRATLPQSASSAALKFTAFLAHHARRIANELLPYVHSGSLLLTHSYSTTVLAALQRAHGAGKRFGVVCTESRPQREGLRMARALARSGIAVEVIVDASAALFLHGFYTLLIGADALSSDGVVNKVGTFGMALAARSVGVPVYCLAGSEKLLPRGAPFTIIEQLPDELVDAEPNLQGFNLYSDQTPLDLVTRFFTEDGVFSPAEMRERLRTRALHPALSAVG